VTTRRDLNTTALPAVQSWRGLAVSLDGPPLGCRDLVAAHLSFVLFRLATTCGVYGLVVAPFGVYGPPSMFPIPVLRFMKTHGITHEQLAMVASIGDALDVAPRSASAPRKRARKTSRAKAK